MQNLFEFPKRLVFYLSFFLLFAWTIPAKSETCGICSTTYLSCLSKGGSSCESSYKSCQSVCMGNSSESSNSSTYKSGFGIVLLILILGGIFYIRSAFNQPRELTLDEKVNEALDESDQADPMKNEQISASKRSLKHLSLLVEKRAEVLEESQLARVCQAYITGKLSHVQPDNFRNSYLWEIYKPLHSESYTDLEVNFHTDYLRAQEIAIKAIKNDFENKVPLDKRNTLPEDRLRAVAWVSIFRNSSNSNLNELTLLRTIKEKEPELFKHVLLQLAKEQALIHTRMLSRKKLPYSSAEDFIRENTHFEFEIDNLMIDECNKIGEELLNDLKSKRELRALKKENKDAKGPD